MPIDAELDGIGGGHFIFEGYFTVDPDSSRAKALYHDEERLLTRGSWFFAPDKPIRENISKELEDFYRDIVEKKPVRKYYVGNASKLQWEKQKMYLHSPNPQIVTRGFIEQCDPLEGLSHATHVVFTVHGRAFNVKYLHSNPKYLILNSLSRKIFYDHETKKL